MVQDTKLIVSWDFKIRCKWLVPGNPVVAHKGPKAIRDCHSSTDIRARTNQTLQFSLEGNEGVYSNTCIQRFKPTTSPFLPEVQTQVQGGNLETEHLFKETDLNRTT